MDRENDRSQAVSLGCGTLILIALIVLFFSGGSTDQIEREVVELRTEVEGLRGDIESLRAATARLGDALGAPADDGGPP